MKNRIRLIRWTDDLTDAERPDGIKKGRYWMRRNWKSVYYHKTDGIHPYDRMKRIIEEHIGQPFDVAFAKYCSQVPKYQQSMFIDEFNKTFRWRNSYTVDEEGLIRRDDEPKQRPPVVFYSHGYKVESRHKTTGREKGRWEEIRKDYNPNDWEDVIVSGYKLTFESRKDRTFKRLMREKIKLGRKHDRVLRAESLKKTYSFLTKTEMEERRDREANKQRIIKHGFDIKHSFRGNGVSPESISDERGY